MPTRAKAPKAQSGGKAAAAKDDTGGRKPNALQRPLRPSAELAAVVGPDPLPRGEVVSKVWEYIRKNELQNPQDRREILVDDARDVTELGRQAAAEIPAGGEQVERVEPLGRLHVVEVGGDILPRDLAEGRGLIGPGDVQLRPPDPLGRHAVDQRAPDDTLP